MVVWIDLVWWGYIVLWAVLLIHCLLKRTFFPIFGPGWGTKVFWLVTFLFMNPLLTLLYLIFGVALSFRKPVGTPHPRLATICLVLVVLVIGIFERPQPNEPTREMTTVRSGQKDAQKKGFRAQVGELRSNNGMTTATSSGNTGHAKFCADTVVIHTDSDHLLIDKVCRIMQRQIAELPYVQEVQYWPAGTRTREPLSRGDVFVTVDARAVSIREFGIKRTVGVNLFCQVGSEPVEKHRHSYYSYSPPMIRFSMNCHLDHTSVYKGFETRKARYQQQSENIAEQFVEAMSKQFGKWIEEEGLLPDLPDYLYSHGPNVVTFEFLDDKDATLVYHSGGLLIGSRTFWTYEDERPNIETFREIRDRLQAEGWRGGYQLDRQRKPDRTPQSFTMRRDDERLQVFRTSGRRDSGGILQGDSETLEKKLPVAVEHLTLLPGERVTELLGRFFKSDADFDAKLIFEDFCREEGLEQLLVDSIESARVKTMDGFLAVGRFYAEHDEPNGAVDALMMARTLRRADRQHNPAENEIKSLAERIGDESLAKTELSAEYFNRAGFIDLADVNDPAVFERGVNEPLLFYATPTDGSQEKIETIAITIGYVPGTEDQYEVTTVEKAPGSSSVGTRGLTQVVFFNDPSESGKMFHLETETLGDDRFKLTFRKGRDHMSR